MEQIRNYVEAMFASLPQNADMESMKCEMLENLEEKYHALLSEGRNEYEAVGIVMAGIGTSEELRAELGFSRQDAAQTVSHAEPMQHKSPIPRSEPEFKPTPEQAEAYRTFRSKFALAIAISVGLFILSPIVNLFFGETLHLGILGNFTMFALVAIGVATIIHWGLRSDFYESILGLGSKPRRTRISADDPLIAEYSAFIDRFSLAISGAVALFIMSPIAMVVFEDGLKIELLGMLAMFGMVAVGVGLCIVWGMRYSAYQEQLGTNEVYHEAYAVKSEGGRFTGLFAGIVFPLAAMFFLYLGFWKGMWHPGWIIFPICGVLTGIVAMIEEFVVQGKSRGV